MRLFWKREPVEWLVVGLGNPGPEYAETRHNVGFRVVDALAARAGVKFCKPQTYMNRSGEAVAPLARRYKVPPERIIVVHDELDLPEGRIKVRLGGNDNGHNGLKSSSECLGTRDYIRVRVGIGRPPAGTGVADWVLGTGGPIAGAPEAVRAILEEGFATAQSHINARK